MAKQGARCGHCGQSKNQRGPCPNCNKKGATVNIVDMLALIAGRKPVIEKLYGQVKEE